MTKRTLIIVLALSLLPLGISFSQDQTYGDYLITGIQKTVSLDLEGAGLVDVLKLLSQQTGLNFVSTEAVRDRTLTLYLEDVGLKEAMDIIFKANNLTYNYYPDSNIFVVKEMGKPAIEMKSKVYYLKYARVKEGRLSTEIEDGMDSEGDSGSSSSSSSSDSGGGEDEGGIKVAVESVLSEFGKINADPITNSLIVIDVPSQFPMIDEVVSRLDIAIPKVLIEVEMLDVSKDLVDRIGVKFANADIGTFTAGTMQTMAPWPKHFLRDIAWSATPARALTMSTLDLSQLEATLEFLKTDTSTKFLARPKIMTLSNETAEVNITTDTAIGVKSLIQDGERTESVERAETGTKLRVTPQINPHTKEITLFVDISNKDAENSAIRLTSMDTGFVRDPSERGAKAVLRLRDGETLLMGGLITRDESDTITKWPLFGDIPFIGRFFRHRNTSNEKRELLVFLTPRLVDDTPFLAQREQILHREQSFTPKKESIRVALDRFGR